MSPEPVLQVVAAVVLLALPVPVYRIVLDPRFRQLFPRWAVAIGALGLGWGVLVALLGVLRPEWLVASAGAGVVVAGVGWWRARHTYGRARDLPPGSLSVSSSVRDLADRHAYRRHTDRHGPIFKVGQFHRPVIGVVGLERGQRLFREHADAVGPSPLPFTQQLTGGFLRYMDDTVHDRYGPLLRRALSQRAIAAAAPVASASARRELDQLESSSATDVDPALERIASESIVHALFGLQRGTPEFEEYTHHARRLASSSIMHPLNRRSLDALDGQRAIVERKLVAIRNEEGAVPACALSELDDEPAGMPDAVCVDNLLMMAKIGIGNLVGLLRWTLVMLAAEPDWFDRLGGEARSPRPGGPTPDPFDAFVMETLRLAQSEYIYRRLTRDVEFDGYRLPAGWRVRVCVAESHRDPQVFPDPDRFTDRFVGRRPSATEHCPFGFGRHACTGASLATMVTRAFLVEVARSRDLIVVHNGEVTREPRHWSHWRPAPPVLVGGREGAPTAV